MLFKIFIYVMNNKLSNWGSLRHNGIRLLNRIETGNKQKRTLLWVFNNVRKHEGKVEHFILIFYIVSHYMQRSKYREICQWNKQSFHFYNLILFSYILCKILVWVLKLSISNISIVLYKLFFKFFCLTTIS